ncbi:MAG: PmoA family protein [Planctomycetota bacterium]|nr:PmoA family protein [Planctomycetota bacterium]
MPRPSYAALTLAALPAPFLLAGCSTQEEPAAVKQPAAEIEERDGAFTVRVNGEYFTEYRYGPDTRKPYLYPIHAPGGIPITRGWPMEELPDEAHDHPHHTSLWFAHGDVNGHDFWHGGDTDARILFTGMFVGDEGTTFEHTWVAGENERVLTERRRMRFSGDHEIRTIDLDIELTPIDGPVTFGDTKEGTMALRLHPALRLSGPVAQGEVQNSEGVTGKDVWGKRAKWVVYSGPIDDQVVSVALFDHPENPRHPTWWHARDYGLFAANPFGAHDFEGAPEGTGDLTLEPDESLRFRYRVLIRLGTAEAEALERAWKTWSSD